VVSAQVLAFDNATGSYAYASTDSSGAFAIPVFPATYAVKFTFGSGTAQYAHQQTDPAKAAQFTVKAGATVMLEEKVLPSGSVAGRLTESDGRPAAGAQVSLSGLGPNENLYTSAAADGTYRFDMVPPGTYVVNFTSGDFSRRQWAFHTIDRRKATNITVRVGQTTTVDDRFLPTGALRIAATDAATGAPIADFCVSVLPNAGWSGGCSNGTGQVTLTGLPAGDVYEVDLNTLGDTYLSTVLHNVKVTGDSTNALAVAVQHAAVIETTTVDARTHQPVPRVCVSPEGPSGPVSAPSCSDDNGKLRIGGLPAGTYTLFARPLDGVHGMQWVGTSGGTGSQYAARQVTLATGAHLALPPIGLDPAGRIAGTVTDNATGRPVAFACVATVPVDPGFAHIPDCPNGAFTDAQGRYTITGLGPYAWPVEFAAAQTYAWRWSGGVASRKQATPVTVTAGRTATSNAKLTTGTLVSGTVTTAHGHPLTAFVVAVNSDTGDAAGALTDTGSQYGIPLLPQTIRLTYRDADGAFGTLWYNHALDFEHATPVTVGTSPLTINLATF
jgi:hypothetical protein